MNVLSATGEALVLIGTFFYFLSALGLIRMPDVYNRMQTSTKSATLGSLGVIIGTGLWAVGMGHSVAWIVQTVVVATFILLTNPISAHALIRGAYRSGIPLWNGSVVDKYGEHLEAKAEAAENEKDEGDGE
ncbi:monovalent cation/H(+) antiporter subunit G [Thermococcus sp.]|uniref:monovalent cation/H(+) antiporter subunit G n=1 Tax=Thermococcus sp. TaxID=35749 RepID=UPI00262C876D|nr:monovalent cation/H(+) antiporter subunit G [Thermococcus sp.]